MGDFQHLFALECIYFIIYFLMWHRDLSDDIREDCLSHCSGFGIHCNNSSCFTFHNNVFFIVPRRFAKNTIANMSTLHDVIGWSVNFIRVQCEGFIRLNLRENSRARKRKTSEFRM